MLSDKVLKVILEYLNLEENEEFGIEDSNYIRRINKKGIQFYINSSDGWISSAYLNELLLGKVKMIKLPFVPTWEQTYYYPNITTTLLYEASLYYNGEYDKHRVEHKLCFRTKEEAIRRAREILGLIEKGDE